MSLASIPESRTVVLCGDFNLPHLDWAEPSSHLPLKGGYSEMLDITQDLSLQQFVSELTRGMHTLDLLITNDQTISML